MAREGNCVCVCVCTCGCVCVGRRPMEKVEGGRRILRVLAGLVLVEYSLPMVA